MAKHDCPQCGQDMRLPPNAYKRLLELEYELKRLAPARGFPIKNKVEAMTLADDARVIEEATPGPWEDSGRYGAVVTKAFPITPGEPSEAYGGVPICESAKKQDRAFIARARTRYPELVAEVRELRAALIRVLCTCGPADDPDFAQHADYCQIRTERALANVRQEGA